MTPLEEQLRANKEVKVGTKREPKFLHEALASQLQQKSSESIKVLQQPSTDVTDVDIPQQQAPAAKAK